MQRQWSHLSLINLILGLIHYGAVFWQDEVGNKHLLVSYQRASL